MDGAHPEHYLRTHNKYVTTTLLVLASASMPLFVKHILFLQLAQRGPCPLAPFSARLCGLLFGRSFRRLANFFLFVTCVFGRHFAEENILNFLRSVLRFLRNLPRSLREVSCGVSCGYQSGFKDIR